MCNLRTYQVCGFWLLNPGGYKLRGHHNNRIAAEHQYGRKTVDVRRTPSHHRNPHGILSLTCGHSQSAASKK